MRGTTAACWLAICCVWGADVATAEAAAGPKKLTADGSYLRISARNDKVGGKWKFALDVKFRVFGPVADGDAVRFDVFKGKRKLSSFRCSGRYDSTNTIDPPSIRAGSRGCRSKATLKGAGTLKVKMTYIKGADDSKTALGEYAVKIGTVKRRGSGVRYQVMPADAMGLGWIWLNPVERGKQAGRLRMYFVAPMAKNYPHRETALRCKKDGKPAFHLPRVGWYALDKTGSYSETKKSSKEMKWAKIWVKASDIGWGQWPQKGFTTPKQLLKPGAYACQFRVGGKLIREFRFSYTKDHRIALHPLQASGAYTMGPQRYLVELAFPKKNDYEWVFPKKEMTRSVLYGKRWPASCKKSVKAFPRKRGSLKAPR
jgi:hypothetical protein